MSTTCLSDATDRQLSVPVGPTPWFPEDLRAWLTSPALVHLAHHFAQEHTLQALRPVFSFSATRFHHPWRMLALLAYAYASGIWSSRAIAEMAAIDPRLADLCHGEPPSENIIQRFRAQNVGPIRRCLEHLLRQIWCERHDTRPADMHPLLIAEIFRDVQRRLRRAEENDDPRQGPHDGPLLRF
jgi:hypothetical protein